MESICPVDSKAEAVISIAFIAFPLKVKVRKES
jgi:hypothetical protein